MDVANDAVEFVDEDDLILLREGKPARQSSVYRSSDREVRLNSPIVESNGRFSAVPPTILDDGLLERRTLSAQLRFPVAGRVGDEVVNRMANSFRRDGCFGGREWRGGRSGVEGGRMEEEVAGGVQDDLGTNCRDSKFSLCFRLHKLNELLQ